MTYIVSGGVLNSTLSNPKCCWASCKWSYTEDPDLYSSVMVTDYGGADADVDVLC